MADERHGGERPRWLDVVVTVVPPLSLVTSLLVYFSWQRRNMFAAALGFAPGLLGNASVLDYLLSSAVTVFFPLQIALAGLLLWLGVDRLLRRWARDPAHRQAVSRVSWALPVGGATLVGGAELLRLASPAAAPYVTVSWPFLLALAVLAAAYGVSLHRLTSPPPDGPDRVRHRWAITVVVGLLVASLLFDGMYRFAGVVGRGYAERVIEQPGRYTQPVVLYSAQDLQLAPSAAIRQALPGPPDAAYHYRYQGLRLVFVEGSVYFLIGLDWRPGSGTLIVLPEAGIRIEFPRPPA